MLTKQKILHLALTLVKSADNDLIKDGVMLAGQNLDADDIVRVKEIVQVIYRLCHDYSYLSSSAFDLEIKSKSSDFREMKIKMESSPIKKKARLEALYECIRNANDDTSALCDLVRENQQLLVTQLRDLLNELPFPGN